jgi:FtsH-binding integral membrane protein
MRQDLGIGLGLLIACGVLYWQAGSIPTPPFVPFGPAFYPRVILILLAGLSVWLVLEAVAGRRTPARAMAASGPAPNYRLVVLSFAVFFAYVLGLSTLGYVASTTLFVLALSWVLGPRNPRDLPKLLALALGTAAVTFVVFEKYLYVFLPRGVLF